MKKVFNIIAITLFALALTGCGNKNIEVTCTKNNEKMIINFQNNKVIKMVAETKQTYDNAELLNMAYQSMQLTVEAYNNMNGANAEVTKENNTITMKLTLDIPNMNSKDIDEDYYNQNVNDFIKSAKEDGYSCTTKKQKTN